MLMDEGIIRYVSQKYNCDKWMQDKSPKVMSLDDMCFLVMLLDYIYLVMSLDATIVFRFGYVIGEEQVW
jgi:hypothetical protein